jgi:hypothetical protein
MVERFFQADEELFAVLSNGQLLNATLSKLEWKHILPDIGNMNAMTGIV